jgi:RNA polymerase sigma factor (sigma-70 family)
LSAAVSVPDAPNTTPHGWHTLRVLPKIRKLVRRRVFNAADREDLEQHLVVHALKAEATFRESRETDFWAYFYRFVRGRLYRELRGIQACGMRSKGGEATPEGEERGRVPVPIRLGELAPEAVGAIEVNAETELDAAHAVAFLATLKPIPRAVVDMVVDGMSYADIGAMLQLSRERVRQIHLAIVRKRRDWR